MGRLDGAVMLVTGAARGGGAFEALKASYAPSLPLGRQGRPEEQAAARPSHSAPTLPISPARH